MKRFRPYRCPTDRLVTIRTSQGTKNCKVVDVTRAGAKLTGVNGLKNGDKVRLVALSHQLSAIVRWVDGQSAGVEFQPQLSQMQYNHFHR